MAIFEVCETATGLDFPILEAENVAEAKIAVAESYGYESFADFARGMGCEENDFIVEVRPESYREMIGEKRPDPWSTETL